MLDIEYIKKIDEVLEVEGFKLVPPYQNKVVQMSNYTMYVPSDDLWILGEEFSENKFIYPLYLQRVIEAINKKNFNEGSYSFSYQILTEIDNYHVYDKYKEKTLERFYFGKRHDYDTKKEQAIIYIMDHIKEKA